MKKNTAARIRFRDGRFKRMSDDNPYAAPQTLKPQQLAVLLPLAKSLGDPPSRRLFADWDTARLKVLWERSRAIFDMQVVWLVMCFASPFLAFFLSVPLMYFGRSAGTSILSLLGVSFMLLTFVRFGTGFARTEQGRAFALAMDGLLGLGCVAAIAGSIVLAMTERGVAFQTVFVLPIATLIGFQTVRSMRAMLQAPELFGPEQFRHEDLCDEVVRREQHQID